MLWILDLQSHQKADGFQRVEALVDVVAQEDVLVALHFVLVGEAEVLKKTHQVEETTVDAAEDLDWRPNPNQTRLFEY